MIKILFIGNSFSEDASRYLEEIGGGELYVRNAAIGGCSLERHARNVEENLQDYSYQKDSEHIRMITVREALLEDAWDYVSIQQVSTDSGLIESYEPYIGILIDEIRRCAPGAKIVFHRTWAYEYGSAHPMYSNYSCDTDLMNDMIEQTVRTVCEKYSLPVIQSGRAVYKAYNTPEFDIRCGGMSITRDSFHLSFDYGRYLAGLMAYKFFTGKPATRVAFSPEGCDEHLIEILKKIADGTE